MTTTADVLQKIRAHGEAAYPEEGCGFLLGTMTAAGAHVTTALRAGNERGENRARRYAIAPDAFRTADEAARADGLDVIGFYHSHPDHPARPSATDLEEATFPGYVYVILSVENGAAADLTAWTLAPDRSRFASERISTEATPATT